MNKKTNCGEGPKGFFASGLIVSGCLELEGISSVFFSLWFWEISSSDELSVCIILCWDSVGISYFLVSRWYVSYWHSVSRKFQNQERKTKSRVWLFFLFCCLFPFSLWELDFLLDTGSSKRSFSLSEGFGIYSLSILLGGKKYLEKYWSNFRKLRFSGGSKSRMPGECNCLESSN